MANRSLALLNSVGNALLKAAVGPIAPSSTNGWGLMVREPFSGAWQRNMERPAKNILTNSALYAVVTLITSDIGKLASDGIGLQRKDAQGIWNDEDNPAYSKVLRTPNRYQNRIKFVENWTLSKLLRGNTYVLKERDNKGGPGRGNVSSLYILDPDRVRPLVAPDGSVFYSVGADNLAGLTASNTFPASEIIHDVGPALFHPLCGVSPITAAALAAIDGLEIQEHSVKFFANAAKPGGLLTAPHTIPQETADNLKRQFESYYGGQNIGKILVAGDGLEFKPMDMIARDSQLIEQLKWTAEQICMPFHVPPFMIGVGTLPSYNNVQALTQMYYSQALQEPIESFELCLGQGLELAPDMRINLDLDALLQMDTATRVDAAVKGIGGRLFAPNESRKKFNLGKVLGGDTVYGQHQDYALSSLAKRDAKEDPFGTSKPEPANDPGDDPGNDPGDTPEEDQTDKFIAALDKKFAGASLHA